MARDSRAERAGLTLVDVVATTPEALAMGVEPELCRYTAEQPAAIAPAVRRGVAAA